MKYIILDKNKKDILKIGSFQNKQINKYKNLGYEIDIVKDDFPKDLKKWEIKKENGKYIPKTKKEIKEYWIQKKGIKDGMG